MYVQGQSERLLGSAFRGRRHDVVIASKVGYRFSSQRRLLARVKPLVKPLVQKLGIERQRVPSSMLSSVPAQEFSPAYITAMVEGSLQRLQTDYLDIYQLHSPPLEVIQRGEFVATLDKLKQQGKIRYWGIACDEAEDGVASLEYAGVASIQVGLSLLHQEALAEAIPRAHARGVGVIARQAFASGLLTKRPEDVPAEHLAAEPAAAERRRAGIASYARQAEQRGLTLPAMALRFVLDQPGVSVALVGMYRRQHLDQCLSYLAQRPSNV
jgi:aryl-alcohol dehydrogenase-like predicted oxidoreductase